MLTSKEQATPEKMTAELQRLADRLDLKSLEEALYFPKFFQIETTRLCNATCTFCAVDLWDKTTPFMSDKLFHKIADEIIEHRDWINFVDLQRSGEPLLDKKIYDRVGYMKDGGVKWVVIATNASGLNDANAKKLLNAGIDEVMLSIDSVDKETYENSRVGLKYEPVIENIRNFFRLRNEMRPSTVIRVRGVSFYDEDNEQHLSEMAGWSNFWADLKRSHDRIYFKRAHNWGNQKEFEDGKSVDHDWVYHPCIIPWSTMHITAMGTVALCPQDYDGLANLGNINGQSIAEVWRAHTINKVRKQHAAGERNNIKLCQGCRIFDEEFSLEKDENVQDKIAEIATAAE